MSGRFSEETADIATQILLDSEEFGNLDPPIDLRAINTFMASPAFLAAVNGEDPTAQMAAFTELVGRLFPLFATVLPEMQRSQRSVVAAMLSRADSAQAVFYLFSGIRHGLEVQGAAAPADPTPRQVSTWASAAFGKIKTAGRRAMSGVVTGIGAVGAVAGVAMSAAGNAVYNLIYSFLPDKFKTLGIASGKRFDTFTDLFDALRSAGLPSDNIFQFIQNLHYMPSSNIAAVADRNEAAANHLKAAGETEVALKHFLTALFFIEQNADLIGRVATLAPAERMQAEALCAEFIQAYFELVMTANALDFTREIANRTLYTAYPSAAGPVPARAVSGFVGSTPYKNTRNVGIKASELGNTVTALRARYDDCVGVIRGLEERGNLVNRDILGLIAALPAAGAMFPSTQEPRLALIRNLQGAFRTYLSGPDPRTEAVDPTISTAMSEARRTAYQGRLAEMAAAEGDAEAAALSRNALRGRITSLGSNARAKNALNRMIVAQDDRRMAAAQRMLATMAEVLPRPGGAFSPYPGPSNAGGAGAGAGALLPPVAASSAIASAPVAASSASASGPVGGRKRPAEKPSTALSAATAAKGPRTSIVPPGYGQKADEADEDGSNSNRNFGGGGYRRRRRRTHRRSRRNHRVKASRRRTAGRR
jgi:hypothetical protein